MEIKDWVLTLLTGVVAGQSFEPFRFRSDCNVEMENVYQVSFEKSNQHWVDVPAKSH